MRLFDLSTRTSMKLRKKGARFEKARQCLDAERPGVEPLYPLPKRLLPDRHFRAHLSPKAVGSWIERPVGYRWLLGKIKRRADAEISAASAVHEVMHHSGIFSAAHSFLVIFEIMRVAGHGNPHVVLASNR
jgi:hypothetical protein